MSTEAQKWAQKRNFGKARVLGMHAQVDMMSRDTWVLPNEKRKLLDAKHSFDILLQYWDNQNPASKNRHQRLTKGE